MQFQIFVSYAHNDDLVPEYSTGGKGFVTTLRSNLRLGFKGQGPPIPTIWRDRSNVERGEQFNDVIQEGIDGSRLFLVVLSNNWIHRPYCQKELTLFRKRWAHEDDKTFKKRLIVALKDRVADDDWPVLLKDQDGKPFQEGYLFFEPDGDEVTGRDRPFFVRGKPNDEFIDLVNDLVREARGRAAQFGAGDTDDDDTKNDTRPDDDSNGRTIYLAKPAKDMRPSYLRLFDELRGRGYIVVPKLDAEIPLDDAAAAQVFVDEALAKAEISIHLLGQLLGSTPDGPGALPIAPLQLWLAAARAAASAAESGPAKFHRMIWAPRVLNADDGAIAQEREPHDVLKRFGAMLDNDKVESGELSAFVDSVDSHLQEIPQPPRQPKPLVPGSTVFIYTERADMPYARELARLVKQRNFRAEFPVFGGQSYENMKYAEEMLRQCDAVVMCWADAADVWVKSHTPQFKNYLQLGRRKGFISRSVVIGPQPDELKDTYVEFPPDNNEIDFVLDLSAYPKPPPSALDPVFGPPGP